MSWVSNLSAPVLSSLPNFPTCFYVAGAMPLITTENWGKIKNWTNKENNVNMICYNSGNTTRAEVATTLKLNWQKVKWQTDTAVLKGKIKEGSKVVGREMLAKVRYLQLAQSWLAVSAATLQSSVCSSQPSDSWAHCSTAARSTLFLWKECDYFINKY